MATSSLIDTHCHLDFPLFDEQRSALLADCARLGVSRVVVPGVVAEDWPAIMRLAAAHSELLPALGLHPCFLDRHHSEHLNLLAQQLAQPGVCAVGEIGLDLWHGRETLSEQQRYFEAQLQLAEERQLPVLLHVRKAHDEVVALLRRLGFTQGGIVHAFSGSLQQARRYLDLGFCIGVGGGVTYPRAQKLRRTLAALPESALVLETDAPDMPLYGYQGQPNSPCRLPEVLAALAAVRDAAPAMLAESMWRNSCRVLRLDSTGAPSGRP